MSEAVLGSVPVRQAILFCLLCSYGKSPTVVGLDSQAVRRPEHGQEVQPDEYSKRFGLRLTPTEAVERAQYFMGLKGEYTAKDNVLVEVELSAIGFMQKMESGVLVKNKPNQYFWNGTMEAEEKDGAGNLLYRFSPTAATFI